MSFTKEEKEEKFKAIKDYLETNYRTMLWGLCRAYFPEMDIPDTKVIARYCVENNDDFYEDEIKEILRGE